MKREPTDSVLADFDNNLRVDPEGMKKVNEASRSPKKDHLDQCIHDFEAAYSRLIVAIEEL